MDDDDADNPDETPNEAANETDAETIQRMLGEEDLDAERVLEFLIKLLVRDHLADRAKAGTAAINHPTTLWRVEKILADECLAQGGMQGGPIDPMLGTLAILLVTCRERAEDKAPPPNQPPRMRIVRD